MKVKMKVKNKKRRFIMTLVKWNPARSLFWGNDTDLLDRYFTRDYAWTPAVDIEEDEKQYLVTMDLPGLDKKEVDIKLDGDVLTISGEKKDEKQENGKNYHRLERYYGKFERSFRLNEDVNKEQIEANFKNGVLRIALPKVEKAQPKQIQVKVS
jgi:HSP20 family protein